MSTVLLIGGAGYVGTQLQRYLAERNLNVLVYDTFWYPDGVWKSSDGTFAKNISYISADIRDFQSLEEATKNVDAIIHLACISNDPSYELNPNLAKEINYESFPAFLEIVNRSNVQRLIYASSSSVYGIKEEPNVTEDLACEPRTDYSRYKVMCEELVLSNLDSTVVSTILRPSTICGFSRRQRFDLVVNALTISALRSGEIRVDGGSQFRPNLHILDMCRAYHEVLTAPAGKVNREIFNVAGENLRVSEIAELVRLTISSEIRITTLPVIDDRSYRVSGEKIRNILGFQPTKKVSDAIQDIAKAYDSNEYGNLDDIKYYNIRTMKALLA